MNFRKSQSPKSRMILGQFDLIIVFTHNKKIIQQFFEKNQNCKKSYVEENACDEIVKTCVCWGARRSNTPFIQGEARGTKIEISPPQRSPVVLYDVLGGVLVDVESYRGCKMSGWMDGSMSRRLQGAVFEISR